MSKHHRLSKQDRTSLEAKVLENIQDFYQSWHARRTYNPSSKEPAVTGSYMRDFLDQQAGVPDDYRFSTKKRRYLYVYAALRALQRRGLIKTSVGMGENGQEAKNWEPA